MAIDVQKDIESVYAPYTNQSILGSDYYTGSIEDESEFDTPYTMKSRPGLLSVYDRLAGPIKSTFQKYGAPIMGGLFSAFSGIPGVGLLMRNLPNDPYAQNRIDMYGAYRGNDGFIKDKFGYNVGSTLFGNNFMQPGSNSYRSYALQGLRNLDKNAAEDYYQKTYGIKPTEDMSAFDIVKRDIQKKKDPFNQQNVFEGTSDYQGGSGGAGNQGQRDAGPGFSGSGSAAEMGSFKRGGLASL
jgi:hypothetical protein